ncbi:MAG: cell division protein FtsW [Candidatus Liptonbacteria bacterium]|nr:cell division protein FtsW [Candidatus Liptonbacteria bacterium]
MKLLLSNKTGHNPDYFILSAVLMLVIFGLFALASASSDLGKIKFDDSYYFLKKQLTFGVSLGILLFFLGYKIYYKNYKRWALPLLLLNVSALLLTLFSPWGITRGGSSRWLGIGGVEFQPSEILKIIFIIYLAAWLSSSKVYRKRDFLKGFVPFLILSGFICALLLAEPATSTVLIIFASALVMYFMSGARFHYIGLAVLLSVAALGVMIYVTSYRFERLASFLNRGDDALGADFHINQALISLGSGGLTGVGFGNSTNKYLYLPESMGDSIFVIVGEEFGFIGAAVLITVFFIVVLKGFFLSRNVRDDFGRLLLIGFVSVIGIQTFINVAALSGLIPLTGVTLPFISYGSSSLVSFMLMAGIMVNISRYS